MYIYCLSKSVRERSENFYQDRLLVRLFFSLDRNDVLIYAKIKQRNLEILKRGFYLNRCEEL